MGADYHCIQWRKSKHTLKKTRKWDKICRSIKNAGFHLFRHCWIKYARVWPMSRSYLIFVLVYCSVVLLSTNNARSIIQDEEPSITTELREDDHRKLAHLFRGYRHRFEQSNNFKSLRWAFQAEQIAGLCDLCDIGVPLVTSAFTFSFSFWIFSQSFRFVCYWIWMIRHWLTNRSVSFAICTYFWITMFVMVQHMNIWWVRELLLFKNKFFITHFRMF